MAQNRPSFRRLSLFTHTGERKYLNGTERVRFLDALPVLSNPKDRTFCEMLYWTGCRPSEALALTATHIDLDEKLVILRSLKKRGDQKGRHFRPVPLPDAFIQRLERVHNIRAVQNGSRRGKALWSISRTTAWHRVRTVMRAAKITGIKACGRGLRHAYGVHAATHDVPETRIKKWLGHESLETTEVYLDMAGPEDRKIAARMWGKA